MGTPTTTQAGSRTRRLVAAVAVLVALAGCGAAGGPRYDIPHDAASGGQTLRQAQAAVSSIPGLTIDVAGGEPPNIKGNTGYDVRVTVAPGYRIVDGPALVTFLVESAWSVRTGYLPNTYITVSVDTGDGPEFDVDAAAAEGGWVERGEPVPGQTSFSLVNVRTDDGSPARERLGDWPGDVPAFPRGVTARR
jgi:predicted small lipoprotein YifL